MVKGKITKELDDISGKVTIRTSDFPGLSTTNALFFEKVITNGKSVKYLRLQVNGLTLNTGEHGVIVVFTDGTKWQRSSEEIDASSGEGDIWEYSAFMELTPTDIVTFSTKKISKFRLYIYDESLYEPIADQFRASIAVSSKMK